MGCAAPDANISRTLSTNDPANTLELMDDSVFSFVLSSSIGRLIRKNDEFVMILRETTWPLLKSNTNPGGDCNNENPITVFGLALSSALVHTKYSACAVLLSIDSISALSSEKFDLKRQFD